MDEWKDAWLDGWINNDMNKKTHLGTPNVEWIFHGIFREMFMNGWNVKELKKCFYGSGNGWNVAKFLKCLWKLIDEMLWIWLTIYYNWWMILIVFELIKCLPKLMDESIFWTWWNLYECCGTHKCLWKANWWIGVEPNLQNVNKVDALNVAMVWKQMDECSGTC